MKLIERILSEEQLEECLRNKRIKKYNNNIIDGIKDGKAYNEYENSNQMEIKDILKYKRATFDEEACFEKMVARYKAMCK